MADVGIVYVAAGQPYVELAKKTVEKTLRHLKEEEVCVIDMMAECTDPIKTVCAAYWAHSHLWQLSPFEYTIKLDLDSEVHDRAILEFVKPLRGSAEFAVVNQLGSMKGDVISGGIWYQKFHELLPYQFPVYIPSGGIWAFKKCDNAQRTFELWSSAKERTGYTNELSALTWALQNTPANVHWVDATKGENGWSGNAQKWELDGKPVFSQSMASVLSNGYDLIWKKHVRNPKRYRLSEDILAPYIRR